MLPKNSDTLAILKKKSVIIFTIFMTLTLWFTYSQYFNYREYYFDIEKTKVHLDSHHKFYFASDRMDKSETHLPASITTSGLKTSNNEHVITSFKTANNEKSINESVIDEHLLTQTTANNRNNIWCKKLVQLTDINQSDTNMFFIETSCGTEELMKINSNSGIVHLNPRQCCAIESAALTNRNHNVYVLHTCPLNATTYSQSPEYIKQTLAHPNVHIVYLRLDEIFQQSPVEELYHSNKIAESKFPVEHLSDVLRLLILWKFGGTYLDLDTINIRPLDDLKYNYAGWQHATSVANGVLNFKYNGTGHNILTDCLKELNNAFDGLQWSSNGPELVTRILLRMCKFETVTQLAKEKCDSFTIYPPVYFYPIYYPNYDVFFKEADSQKISDMFSGTYNIHFWNKMSSKSVIEVGRNQLYGILANKYCPGVYHNCGKYF